MKNSLAPLASHCTTRNPKGVKFISIVEAAYNKADLSDEEAQNVNDTAGLPALVSKFIADSRSPKLYASEEVVSHYGYLSGYTKPKEIAQQIKIIHDLFPDVKWGFFLPDESEIVVPTGAEGLFAIPRWQSMAPTYGEAVQTVLAKLNETRKGKFINYRKDDMGSDNLRESARKAEVIEQIAQSQQKGYDFQSQKGYDIRVIPAQFGLVHRGRSVRRARVVIGRKGFGLGAFEIGIMLLTHPERLQNYDDLWIDCAGDEFKPSGGHEFSDVPFFGFGGDWLRFGANGVGRADGRCGSASGFLRSDS